MKYGFHFTPCPNVCASHLLVGVVKLAAFLGAGAGVVWTVRAATRAAAVAAADVTSAATAAGPAVFLLAGVAVVAFSVALVAAVMRNNARPPLIPNDRRPVQHTLAASTVEVVAVTRTGAPRALPRPRPRALPAPAPQLQPLLTAQPERAKVAQPVG